MTTPSRSRRRTVTLWVVVLALFGAAAVGFATLRQGEAVAADVGACLESTGTDSLSVVACDAPTAEYTVVGKLVDRTSIDAGLFACSDFPTATTSYWQGREGVGEKGTVLCLAPTG
ncbi:LppU/SCO3897 family protein [Pseudonocardia abyssalis]|uniref:Septum formation-related domain-containing protein n=1 Tax=Pseudonocardia abyssalis TaxID=2792008 RepID=A0ABS6UZV8_9PSEU|nr:hypothetical protein [Pseudonocardia abyssalis]MBW0115317.1 hypothetical protein [Pseudonocardia abyssalis]MBW0137797.1 hypothetical protein [Pseudonocardia abyssalis]